MLKKIIFAFTLCAAAFVCFYTAYSTQLKLSGSVPPPTSKQTLIYDNIERIINFKHDKKVLLISHDLYLAGAQRTLLHMAIALQKNGFYPVVLSPQNGPIAAEIRKSNIPLLVDSTLIKRLQQKDPALQKFFNSFDTILFNTLVSFPIAPLLPETTARKIGWIHEGSVAYSVFKFDYSNLFKQFDKIYSCSEYAQSFANQYIHDKTKSDVLMYGLPDMILPEQATPNKKVQFVLAGTVEKRKGQDIFLETFHLLSPEVKAQSVFYLAGAVHDKAIEKSIKETAAQNDNLKYMGLMPHADLMTLYRQSDVILTPSRDDPMPLVCTEGMIMKKVVIVSKNTGTAAFIKNGYNGYTIDAENAQQLADAITRVVLNKKDLPVIGNRSREIYDTYFSMPVFEKRIVEIFEGK